MNWTQGFTYIFADRKWMSKMFIGALATSFPVVEAITNGYQMQVIENIKAGNPQPLPEWKNADKMFGRGFKLWLAVNLFYIPSIIISVISWFLGIPMLLAFIADFIATTAADDFWYRKGISYIASRLIIMLVAGIGTFLGSVALPVVFFFVPAMALRCQETNSLASTLNLFAHLKFVLLHLGSYIGSRVSIIVMFLGMEVIASILGTATVWIAGLGILVAWFIFGAARFWSRLAWAYFLVEMRRQEQHTNGTYHINQLDHNPPAGMIYTSSYPLTRTTNKYHY